MLALFIHNMFSFISHDYIKITDNLFRAHLLRSMSGEGAVCVRPSAHKHVVTRRSAKHQYTITCSYYALFIYFIQLHNITVIYKSTAKCIDNDINTFDHLQKIHTLFSAGTGFRLG